MKELSIEQKAKAYDEAIERIKNIKTGKCETTFMFTEGLLEHIFPELAESKDERIRKDIVEAVELHKDFTQERKEHIYAWLEKQGEQKPADSKIIDLDELVIELEETIGTSPHSRETIKDFFQKAVQKYMRCLQIANGEIGRLMDENYYLKEQKSAEWSEEDKDMLGMLLEMINYASDHYQHDDKATDIKAWVLKSLRQKLSNVERTGKNWKPSKEQTDALLYIFRHYAPSATDKLAWDALQTLELMLAQLKKLREE